jgi:PAS domain S-box-containing protein
VGRPLQDVFHIVNEFTREAVENPVERVLRDGATVGLANHTILIAQDGTEIPIDDSAAPIRSESGELQGVVLVFRDVTERRRAELNDRLLASIVESSDDAIISKDLNGIVTSWNRGAQKIFGYTAAEVIGRPIATIADPSNPAEMPAILKRIRRGDRVDHFQSLRRAKDGELVNISLTVSPVYDSENRIIGASKIARDITGQLRDQKALAAQNAELYRANTDLSQFAYAVSHDLRELLRNIANYAELLVRRFPQGSDGDSERFKGFIVQGVVSMEALLNDLLTYSLLGGPQAQPPTLLDCNEILAKVLQNLHTSILENQAVITNDPLPPGNGPRIAPGPVVPEPDFKRDQVPLRSPAARPHPCAEAGPFLAFQPDRQRNRHRAAIFPEDLRYFQTSAWKGRAWHRHRTRHLHPRRRTRRRPHLGREPAGPGVRVLLHVADGELVCRSPHR